MLTGLADLGNSLDGVAVVNSANVTIGGTSPGAGNIISGNDTWGVRIFQPGATGNVVLGNLIGTDRTGAVALGNTMDGVLVQDADNNTIGGTDVEAGNVISGNGSDGIVITLAAEETARI